ncbi:hypothetical protein BZG35_08610 [Brevundimonas sp. LM2]|nr:hypothetical protein BZG35_08610 [Brevundimonas sp. LM2]
MFETPAASPPAAIVIEVSLEPSAPPLPDRETPPGPEQQESAPKPKPQPDRLPPIPTISLPVKAAVVLPARQERPEEERPEDEERAEATTAPAAVPAPPSEQVAAPAVGRSAAAPSNAEQAWEARVLAQLERNKRYPAAAQRAGQEDVVYVRLTLDRSGRVLDARVRRSRGYAALDGEVLALARRASPLPAPPAEIEGDRITLTVPVEFFLSRRR